MEEVRSTVLSCIISQKGGIPFGHLNGTIPKSFKLNHNLSVTIQMNIENSILQMIINCSLESLFHLSGWGSKPSNRF